MHDTFNAILLNIAAAIIFWLAFAFVPEKRRRRKLRPKLELGIYQVYSTLFGLFDSLMRFEVHSPSSFQKRIKGKVLHSVEIELGLQNKCLNETFLYDEKVSRLLIPMGKELFQNRITVDGRCAAVRVGDVQYRPANPSLSYMGTSLAELYRSEEHTSEL